MRPSRLLVPAVAGSLVLFTGAFAAAGTGGVSPPSGAVSAVPASSTPHLKTTADNPAQQIRQLVQCGGTMYAVGSFTEIVKGSTTYTRENIFSFSATAPYTVTSWAPDVAGGIVNTIAFNGGSCADAYIGGQFTSVNGTAVKDIAEISTTTGNVVGAFGSNSSASVETLLGVKGHILAGGYYKSINGSSAHPYMTSLSPATGKDDGFVHLSISGQYNSSGATRVYNQQLSHGGTLDLVEGDFTSVGGLQREQIFMLNLGGAAATVTGWTSPQWDGSESQAQSQYQCVPSEAFYLQAAAWSPDDSTIYIATTGYHANGAPTGHTPRTGLCDAAASFPATQASVKSNWINYTGCDSLFAAAADASSAYFAGHERFSMNPDDCDALGSGGYNAPGIKGLQPSTGKLYINSAGTAGYYSRARGLGADDMLVTSAGLWIASDNLDGSEMCGGTANLFGICFLPYTG
jgi:hypothetical protein